jgi:mannitol-1-phosphate 5-dehydrogenase
MRILHFGGGRIGMGLIVPLFYGGNDLILVDRKQEHISKLANSGYNLIETVNDKKNICHIQDFKPIIYSELENIREIDIITTSVIEHNLPDITPYIADLIKKKSRRIYIIPMENSFDSTAIIKSHLKNHISNFDDVYFLRSVIDRIVPGFTETGDVICEPYSQIKVERRHSISDLLPGSMLCDRIEFEFEKKLFIVNGLHACAAYLGYKKNLNYIHECINDREVRKKLTDIGNCYAQYLGSIYNMPAREFDKDIVDTLDRFSNYSILDPLERVGRNLLIKLSDNGRILKPLIYNKENGLMYAPLQEVVVAAKRFSIANDYDDYLDSISNPTSLFYIHAR